MVVLCLTHCIGNTATTLGMLNPEVADAFVGIRQGQVAALRVRKTGGIEVKLHVVFLGPLNPTLEVLHLYLITIHELTAEVSIDLMEVQTVITGDEGLHEFNVFAYLIYITGTTGIVACGLDATRQGVVALKTNYVVCLPAMQ